MTVPTTTAFTGPYYPNGVTVEYPFAFKVNGTDEVSVFYIEDDGSETIVPSADYSVVLSSNENNPGGTVTTAAPLPDSGGKPLYIALDPDFTQSTKFEDEGAFNQSILNPTFDAGALRSIWLRARLLRAPILPLDPASVIGKFPFVMPDGSFGWSFGTGSDPALRSDLAGPSGADMVGIKQPGPNTVARSLSNKISEFVSVADYLPVDYVTDGSVDYTTAIQKCIDENRLVKFPRGIFRHARLVQKYEDQVIRGDGRASTILYCPTGYAITNFAGDDDDPIGADWFGGLTVEHLTLRGGFSHTDDFSPPANSWAFATGRSKAFTTADVNAGLRLKRCYPYNIENVIFENFHRGIYASAAALASISKFLFRDCEYGFYGENGAVWGEAAWQITTHEWTKGQFRNCWIGIGGSDFVQCTVENKTVDFEPCNTGIAIFNGGDNVWSGYFELCCEGIYRNGSFMGHDIIEDPFFGGSPGAMWGDGDSILLDNGIGAGGKVTLRNGQGVIGGGGVRVLGGKLYRSEANGKALVFLSPALTPAPSYVPSDIQWALTGGYDDIDVFDAGDPELFTIPAALDGATIVLRANLQITGDATPNDVSIEMRKNGAEFPGMGAFAEVFDYSRSVTLASAPIRVEAGDAFKVIVAMNLARELPTGNRSWLAVEVVG